MKTTRLILILSLFWFACSSNTKNASVEVRLTDAPGDYQAVNIDIQGVEVNATDGNSGWTALDIKKGVYNLMKLSNGLDTLLGKIDLPAGKISQIRLILGTNNTVVVNSVSKSMDTPSAQQSGLKLNLHASLTEGVTYKILLDFDAARSIVATGSGAYILKPVIRAIAEAESGSIKGVVSPVAASPAVYAIVATDTVATTFADATTGKFLLKGVAPGTYTVSFAPKTGYAAQSKTGVSVTLGNVTDLGTVTF